MDLGSDDAKVHLKFYSSERIAASILKVLLSCKNSIIEEVRAMCDCYIKSSHLTFKANGLLHVFFHLQSENKVIIHVNNEQSKNCLSNRGLTVFAVEVAPKSMTVRFF